MKALIEAMDRYDASNNNGFVNYAVVIQPGDRVME